MTGSTIGNASIYKKIKIYTAAIPPPPKALISPSSFLIDFDTRKFIRVGLDPTDNSNVAVHIMTAKYLISVALDILITLPKFTLMGGFIMFLSSEDPIKPQAVRTCVVECMLGIESI